jgi:hypothetical protein
MMEIQHQSPSSIVKEKLFEKEIIKDIVIVESAVLSESSDCLLIIFSTFFFCKNRFHSRAFPELKYSFKAS